MQISRREQLRLDHPWIYKIYKPISYLRWIARGRTLPPVHVYKERTIRDYARLYGLRTWVETGTYLGFMIEELRRDFDRIISIELDPELCRIARKRFARWEHIEVVEGDSGIKLGEVCSKLNKPAIFWLDGHYQPNIGTMAEGETPVLHELNTLFRHWHPGTVVLIDDARLFGQRSDYPDLSAVIAQAQSFSPRLDVSVRDDIIRIAPL
jgi:predicted O-methyltransferase YrrM